MKNSMLATVAAAAMLVLTVATPAAARVSLSSIDQKLDIIIAGMGEPTKIFLSGDVLEDEDRLTGSESEYVVPVNKRLFIREIACQSPAFTAALNSRPFSLRISALISNPATGGTIRQNIATTEFIGDDVSLLASIQFAVFESNTFVEAGDRLVLDLFRRGGGNDGFVNRFTCVLTGFMTDL